MKAMLSVKGERERERESSHGVHVVDGTPVSQSVCMMCTEESLASQDDIPTPEGALRSVT